MLSFNYHNVYMCIILLDALCFTQTSYAVNESVGIARLNLQLSRPLPNDTAIRFLYLDFSATRKLYMFYVHTNI